MNFGDKLKQLRAIRGVNQKEVADYIEVGVSAYSQYEKNTRRPDFKILAKIVEYYETTYDFLLNLDDNKNSKSTKDIKILYHVFHRLTTAFLNFKGIMKQIDSFTNENTDINKYNYHMKALSDSFSEYEASLNSFNKTIDLGKFKEEIEEYFE